MSARHGLYILFAACSAVAYAPPVWAEGELPDEPELQSRISAELSQVVGHEFRVMTTAHFLIFYDTDKAYAVRRGGLLETTHKTYFDAFSRFHPAPRPTERRLPCVLFQKFDDYAAYAEKADGESMAWAAGYYSARTNRIAFFQDRTSPRFKEATQTVDSLAARIAKARSDMDSARRDHDDDAARGARARLEYLTKQQRWLSNRMTVVAAAGDDAKTTHEATHQLAHNTGLQTRGVEYPFWLTEGLATCFEAEDAVKPFGPGINNAGRHKLLTDAHLHGRLIDMERFAAMSRMPEETTRDQIVDLYSQAWGLFQFLYFTRRSDLERYVSTLASARPGPRGGAVMRREFEEAFGPIPKLDRQFSQWLRLRR